MSESTIQQDIVKMLSMHPKVSWCLIVTTGKFRVKNGYITDLNLQVGDWVVVDSSNGLGLALVVQTEGINPNQWEIATAWVLEKVSVDKARQRVSLQCQCADEHGPLMKCDECPR